MYVFILGETIKTFLGAVRVFEFRKKAGAPNFIRFPLFPGGYDFSTNGRNVIA